MELDNDHLIEVGDNNKSFVMGPPACSDKDVTSDKLHEILSINKTWWKLHYDPKKIQRRGFLVIFSVV